MKMIAITSGDPSGIGPEIVGKGLRFYPLDKKAAYIVYGKIDLPSDYTVIKDETSLTGTFKDRNTVIEIESPQQVTKGGFIYNIPIDSDKIIKGSPSAESGKIALDILERAVGDIKKYGIEAILTAPVSKETINLSYKGFIGHTEYLAEKFSCPHYVMNFVGDKFSLALLTTHCSLSEVKDYIRKDYLIPKMRLINQFAQGKYNNEKMALLSINPHGGEGGLFGNEDKILKDIIDCLKEENIHIDGPFAADSFFRYKVRHYKQIVAVYHDQGLIPFKLINGERGVNTTLGLPVIRTSVDHGTAFDIAGKNIASASSFINALQTTEDMIGLDNVTHNCYSVFAKNYDEYMCHVDWDKWKELILKITNKYLGRTPDNVLDIGCGTGLMANKLHNCGFTVEGIDLSSSMLEQAAHRSSDLFLSQGDILSALPDNNYDLIVSLFDCINYILKKNNLKLLFKNVGKALRNSGLFIFDISTKLNCMENFDGSVYINETDDSFIAVRTMFEGDYQELELDIFDSNGSFYEHNKECHQLRIYDVAEIIEIIEKNQYLTLKGIYCLDGMRQINLNQVDNIDRFKDRLFFVLQKK